MLGLVQNSLKRFSKAENILREVSNTLKLGAPLVMAQLTQMSMSVADTIMAGNFSAQTLAAVAVGNSLWIPLFIFVLGVLLAINPIVAQLHGAERTEEIGQNLWQVLWLSLILAVPLFFLARSMFVVMRLFAISQEIIPTTQGYLNAISWCMPAAFAYAALRFWNEGLHITKPSMYFATVGSV
ncbi:MAG: MATE family efflux transporter, partial [bacterium]